MTESSEILERICAKTTFDRQEDIIVAVKQFYKEWSGKELEDNKECISYYMLVLSSAMSNHFPERKEEKQFIDDIITWRYKGEKGNAFIREPGEMLYGDHARRRLRKRGIEW